MYVFIDESGDHNLSIIKGDGTYNVFVLGAVLIEKSSYAEIDHAFKELKRDIFGDPNFIIHTWELTHPLNKKADPRNAILRNPDVRADFYQRINEFIESTQLTSIFCIVRKPAFQDKYAYPHDPYELSFENILNRVLYYTTSDEIEIMPECRGPKLDALMEGEFAKYSTTGTRFHSAEDIAKRVINFECIDKSKNMTGHQLADLLCSPVGRHSLGYKPKPPGNEVPFAVVRGKLAGPMALTSIP